MLIMKQYNQTSRTRTLAKTTVNRPAPVATDQPAALASEEPKPRKLLPPTTVEGYTDGDDRKAKYLAHIVELSFKIFVVIPYYLNEISGAAVQWNDPPKGQPIHTARPIRSFDEAQQVAKSWASVTFATNASLYR